MRLEIGPRRGQKIDIAVDSALQPLAPEELTHFEDYDLIYRSLAAAETPAAAKEIGPSQGDGGGGTGT